MPPPQNAFGHRLLEALLAEQEGNIFISPLSIALALALACEGARGETRQALAGTLGGRDLALEELILVSERLQEVPRESGSKIELAIANSVWIDRSLRLRPAYQRRLAETYHAEARSLDSTDPGALQAVNGWVREKTRGKIERIVSNLAGVQAVLLNAVYFRGAWSVPFEERATRPGVFTTLAGHRKSLPLMRRSGNFEYFEDERLQAIQLPYGEGRLWMEILPAEAASASPACTGGPEGERRGRIAGPVPQP